MPKTLFILFLFTYQFLIAQKKQLPVEVLDATSQNWISGAPGGNSGIAMQIKLLVNTSDPIEFKNVWVGKENLPFETQYYTNKAPYTIHKGDSVLLVYRKIDVQKSDSADAKRLPIPYHGAALIECVIDKKARYFIVKEFKKLETYKGK